ncbi:MAG: sulfotransferase domain-containing protein [Planctomycetota bacterium]
MSTTLLERFRGRLRRTWAREALLRYRHWGIVEHDVFLACYPKSGSTWVRVMLARLLTGEDQQVSITDQRFIPGVKHRRRALRLLPNDGQLIKTHEAFRPCVKRAIYIVRDGRDVAVSYYWQLRRMEGLEIPFEEFLDGFHTGMYDGYGAWAAHVASWLRSPLNDSGALLLVRYEDVKQDAASQLRRMVDFLGVAAGDEDIKTAVELGSFDKMREKEARSDSLVHREKGDRIPVVRKGVVGDWKENFSEASHNEFWNRAGDAMTMAGYARDAAVAASLPSR